MLQRRTVLGDLTLKCAAICCHVLPDLRISNILRLRLIVNKSTMATMNNKGKKILKRIAKVIDNILEAPVLVDQGSNATSSHHCSAGYEEVSRACPSFLSLKAGGNGCDGHEQGKDGSGCSCSDCERFSSSHFGY